MDWLAINVVIIMLEGVVTGWNDRACPESRDTDSRDTGMRDADEIMILC